MSPINAYLTFDGNAAEAMRFYEKTLGGKMQMMMTMGQAPGAEQFAEELHGAHAGRLRGAGYGEFRCSRHRARQVQATLGLRAQSDRHADAHHA